DRDRGRHLAEPAAEPRDGRIGGPASEKERHSDERRGSADPRGRSESEHVPTSPGHIVARRSRASRRLSAARLEDPADGREAPVVARLDVEVPAFELLEDVLDPEGGQTAREDLGAEVEPELVAVAGVEVEGAEGPERVDAEGRPLDGVPRLPAREDVGP